ncbi:DUF3179 domain-containing protein [Spiribacter vilamensis]|uniref:Uncharacterized protein DUF3179 n=1 Tax=Spiribacter vilamensis TaxID=531306 RepID=A0A4Q8CZH5_9GAMM|nr:DUF3179 domain-containing protein [Spiribacter vilamensis]RZU98384.1 uncharacterized protein DUF3179 [Spiribacter vilamensis]
MAAPTCFLHTFAPGLLFLAGITLHGTVSALPLADPAERPVAEAIGRYEADSLAGGPGKDGIPAIDSPQFEAADQSDLDPGDKVIGLYYKGEARAYPQSTLVWHEIVNDTIDGDGIAITYCPLTGSAVGFERGETELGVSGRLVNSNLVMYDRTSDSRFPQILATGITGRHRREALREVRLIWTTWEAWRTRYPQTRVLSRNTGFLRNYGDDPYGTYNPVTGYYRPDSRALFPAMHTDDRYPAKQVVLGLRDRNGAVAIDKTRLARDGVIEFSRGGDHYLAIHDPVLDTGWLFRAGQSVSVDPSAVEFGPEGPRFPGRDALTPINAFEVMWFAWFAFYPDTGHLQ